MLQSTRLSLVCLGEKMTKTEGIGGPTLFMIHCSQTIYRMGYMHRGCALQCLQEQQEKDTVKNGGE
jgi:hypothetical protein